MSEITELEDRLRADLQRRVMGSYDRLPQRDDGEEEEIRAVSYKGNFYLAVKMRGKWRYFREYDIAGG